MKPREALLNKLQVRKNVIVIAVPLAYSAMKVLAKNTFMRKLGILLALFAFALMQGRAAPVLADIATTIERASGLRGMTDIKAYGKITTQRRVIQRKYPLASNIYLSGKKIASENNRRGSSGNRGGGGGVGIGISIDIGKITEQTKKKPPPKKVYRKPKGKKKTTRRKSVQPPVVKTIPQFVPNEVLVLVTSDQPDALGDALAVTFNLTKVETVPVALLEGSIIRFRYSDNRPLSNVITAITTDARVFQAQPNNYYQLAGKKKRSKKSNTQYSLVKLSVGPAHQISKGRDVSVAVIDTGINTGHPSLSKAVASSFNAVGDDKKTVNKHGTAIAGLIAGQGRVQGIAPLSRLLAVRAFYMHREYNKSTTNSMILLRALDWSFANEARIFNMSFAGPFDPLVKRALENAYDKGVILVAAAGNNGPKAAPTYPAAYKNVIAITALDHKDRLYAHANRGNYLTAAAPGVDVLVPSLKKSYSYSSGTSLAAAHISGLIALLLERHPDATSEAIVDAIKKSAHDLGPKGYDTQFGSGRADALASLKLLAVSQ